MAIQVPPGEVDRAARLARGLGLRPLTAQLLLNRGVSGEDAARLFLDPKLSCLRRPDGELAMAGFARAVERLARAVLDGQTIGLFGDYDVDGVTSCAVLARYLRALGAAVVPRVARRDAGYGLSVEVIEELVGAGCALAVTCDCGTSDHAALARARALGIDVIVVDHHQVPEREPDCYALINPHQTGCRFPFKGLASVGVAFYLMAALRTRLRGAPESVGRPALLDPPDPRGLLDLVALGTIADMVPLVDENRALVAHGLRELGRTRGAGMRALLTAAGLASGKALVAQDVSFHVAPLINAPGRLGAAQLALDLLLADEEGEAARLSAACVGENQKRREIQDRVSAEALAALACVEAGREPPPGTFARLGPVALVAGDGWHPGVVGIVAAKLVEKYRRPSLVIAMQGEQGRGSGRVPTGAPLHLSRALDACTQHLVRHGGHAAAAGVTVRRDALAAFAEALLVVAESARVELPIEADAEVPLRELDEALAEELARLGPFGMGNPEPLLVGRDLDVDRTRVVGERHLQITLRQGGVSRDGIAFNLAAQDPGSGARVSVAFVPEIDTFRGQRRLRLRVRHLERAAPAATTPPTGAE